MGSASATRPSVCWGGGRSLAGPAPCGFWALVRPVLSLDHSGTFDLGDTERAAYPRGPKASLCPGSKMGVLLS